jgi:hypothetical protein
MEVEREGGIVAKQKERILQNSFKRSTVKTRETKECKDVVVHKTVK